VVGGGQLRWRRSRSRDGAAEKPNILVIFGDDIGYWNVASTIAA